MSKYKKYTLATKIQVMNYCETHSQTKAEKKFGIARQTIRRRISQKESIQSEPKKLQRSRISYNRELNPSKGCHHPEIEKSLIEWINQKRNDGVIIDGNEIKNQAKIIGKDTRDFNK